MTNSASFLNFAQETDLDITYSGEFLNKTNKDKEEYINLVFDQNALVLSDSPKIVYADKKFFSVERRSLQEMSSDEIVSELDFSSVFATAMYDDPNYFFPLFLMAKQKEEYSVSCCEAIQKHLEISIAMGEPIGHKLSTRVLYSLLNGLDKISDALPEDLAQKCITS